MNPNPASIRTQYEAVLERIEAACRRVGRTSDEITLVAVSKTFSPAHIEALYDCGHRHFGENKAQELVEKQFYFERVGACPGISWHMIGHLQRNKARNIIGKATLLHSLDSVRLARELDKRAEAADQTVECLIQVNISGEQSKYGLAPDVTAEFLHELEPFSRVVPRGLMGMATPTLNQETLRPEFSRLKYVLHACNQWRTQERRLNILSMGMSQDFEVAIEQGATHVRIGSAIFGERTLKTD